MDGKRFPKRFDHCYFSDPLKWRIWTRYQVSTVRWKRFFNVIFSVRFDATSKSEWKVIIETSRCLHNAGWVSFRYDVFWVLTRTQSSGMHSLRFTIVFSFSLFLAGEGKQTVWRLGLFAEEGDHYSQSILVKYKFGFICLLWTFCVA